MRSRRVITQIIIVNDRFPYSSDGFQTVLFTKRLKIYTLKNVCGASKSRNINTIVFDTSRVKTNDSVIRTNPINDVVDVERRRTQYDLSQNDILFLFNQDVFVKPRGSAVHGSVDRCTGRHRFGT